MNIKQAKNEIKQTVMAYLSKDRLGEYEIPSVRQRPILLMGPPGIGKTAIMEQVARECKIGIVSYTITHHTRQSAVGLPFIEKMFYKGEPYSVTEYTMSEIIAAVYSKIKKTGLEEGILFIDEINCVSETLAPTMLQFLQCKMFGNYEVPKGWIIVAAGNPPEYNKSVREFDVVTLDRVRKIDVDADFDVWKEYAYKNRIHGSIMSYLELKRENFYDVRTTVDGKIFVTARGWEDLSVMITRYEKMGYAVTEEFVAEFLQHPVIAKDFTNYYDLYKKYQKDYRIDEIFAGKVSEAAYDKIRLAAFDERYSIITHLLSGLTAKFNEADYQNMFISNVFDMLNKIKAVFGKSGENLRADANAVTIETQAKLDMQLAANLISGNELTAMKGAIVYVNDVAEKHSNGSANMPITSEIFDGVRKDFDIAKEHREEVIEDAKVSLENVFDFILKAFGEEQELILFITELSMNCHAVRFMNEEGCERYNYYIARYLSGNRQREIMDDIRSIREGESM